MYVTQQISVCKTLCTYRLVINLVGTVMIMDTYSELVEQRIKSDGNVHMLVHVATYVYTPV